MKPQLVRQRELLEELRDSFAGIISACVNKGAISSMKLSVGGICGQSFTSNVVERETIIENCYNTGAITANNDVERVGRYLRKRI